MKEKLYLLRIIIYQANLELKIYQKKAEEVKCDVNFKIDANRILTVTAELCENKENKAKLVIEAYKGGISKNEFNIIGKIGKSDPKDNKLFKMRDLRIEMDQYYDKIMNEMKIMMMRKKKEMKVNLI